MQVLTKIVRCSNFLQIYTILNMPALNYKTQSTYLIKISQRIRFLSCPALASEGCHFMRKLCKICPHRSKHHSLLHPLATVRHRTGGGVRNSGTCAEFHIHIRNTSPDRDVSYLEFVFSSYECSNGTHEIKI